MIKDLRTPQIILILGIVFMILTAVVVLTIFGKESTGVYAFGGAILIGLGVMAGTTGMLASNTNGNTSRLLTMLEDNQRLTSSMLSLMQPSSQAAESKLIELSVPVVHTVPVPVPTPAVAPTSAPPADLRGVTMELPGYGAGGMPLS